MPGAEQDGSQSGGEQKGEWIEILTTENELTANKHCHRDRGLVKAVSKMGKTHTHTHIPAWYVGQSRVKSLCQPSSRGREASARSRRRSCTAPNGIVSMEN